VIVTYISSGSHPCTTRAPIRGKGNGGRWIVTDREKHKEA
jgi:hypothetical protein